MDLKIFTNNIEKEATIQIDEMLETGLFKNKIRIMPDVHKGKGCVIGFTTEISDKVIPNLVGVDIGCGMYTVELGNIELNLEELDKVINENIPAGRNIREHKLEEFEEIEELLCLRELKETKKFNRALGTLGGGNHFIEIDIDDENNKYLIIHTGSRNLGHQVASYYQDLAIELCSGKEEYFIEKDRIIKEYKEKGEKSEIQNAIKEIYKKYSNLKPFIQNDLCYLQGEYKEKYLYDMKICQRYAEINRKHIAEMILNELGITEIVREHNTIHNYIDDENMLRKGAISAKKGEIVTIPINMKDGCIIGKGKGNEDWNYSAPHGAGRILSRAKAKKNIKLEEFKEVMKGIYTTSINEFTIDESPMAYKKIEDIVNNIGDTIEIIKIIKPIYNFKATN